MEEVSTLDRIVAEVARISNVEGIGPDTRIGEVNVDSLKFIELLLGFTSFFPGEVELDQLNVDAETTLARAAERAALLVDEEAVVVAARARAEQIVADAEATADALRRDADDYCDRRLADFEIDVSKLLTQVQAGRAKLADRLGGAQD